MDSPHGVAGDDVESPLPRHHLLALCMGLEQVTPRIEAPYVPIRVRFAWSKLDAGLVKTLRRVMDRAASRRRRELEVKGKFVRRAPPFPSGAPLVPRPPPVFAKEKVAKAKSAGAAQALRGDHVRLIEDSETAPHLWGASGIVTSVRGAGALTVRLDEGSRACIAARRMRAPKAAAMASSRASAPAAADDAGRLVVLPEDVHGNPAETVEIVKRRVVRRGDTERFEYEVLYMDGPNAGQTMWETQATLASATEPLTQTNVARVIPFVEAPLLVPVHQSCVGLRAGMIVSIGDNSAGVSPGRLRGRIKSFRRGRGRMVQVQLEGEKSSTRRARGSEKQLDCGVCRHCLDRPKNGGNGTMRKSCVNRIRANAVPGATLFLSGACLSEWTPAAEAMAVAAAVGAVGAAAAAAAARLADIALRAAKWRARARAPKRKRTVLSGPHLLRRGPGMVARRYVIFDEESSESEAEMEEVYSYRFPHTAWGAVPSGASSCAPSGALRANATSGGHFGVASVSSEWPPAAWRDGAGAGRPRAPPLMRTTKVLLPKRRVVCLLNGKRMSVSGTASPPTEALYQPFTLISKPMKTRRERCGECDGCRSMDCGICRPCLDRPKNGGKGTMRKPCVNRICTNLQVRSDPFRRRRPRASRARSALGRVKEERATTAAASVPVGGVRAAGGAVAEADFLRRAMPAAGSDLSAAAARAAAPDALQRGFAPPPVGTVVFVDYGNSQYFRGVVRAVNADGGVRVYFRRDGTLDDFGKHEFGELLSESAMRALQRESAASAAAESAAPRASKTHSAAGSKYRGVRWRRGKWEARIRHGKKRIHLGSFNDEHAAGRAYDKAAIRIRGSGALAELNFPEEE